MKSFDEVTKADERWQYACADLQDLHSELAAISLHPCVPENVRSLFDTALNLSLYSWYVYDFHPIADLTGFLALEAAFRERAALESKSLAKMKLRTLVKHAIGAEWVKEDKIAGRLNIARARVEHRKVIEAIGRTTNSTEASVYVDDPTEAEVAAEADAMQILESMCVAAVDLRNALAHGERLLVPGSYRRLRITADLINQLFSPP